MSFRHRVIYIRYIFHVLCACLALFAHISGSGGDRTIRLQGKTSRFRSNVLEMCGGCQEIILTFCSEVTSARQGLTNKDLN